jgi:hypothetical protein
MSKPIYAVEDLTQAQILKQKHEEACRKYLEVNSLPADTVLTPANVKFATPAGFDVLRTGQAHALHLKWMASEDYQKLQRRLAR